ncbi:MAG: hypothetical protein R3F40_13130 [Candidatus Competibacteraceae bacterium]
MCHIEHFQVRQPTAIRNHLFAANTAMSIATTTGYRCEVRNCYRLQREGLFNEVIAAFIKAFAPNLGHLKPTIPTSCQCVSPTSYNPRCPETAGGA